MNAETNARIEHSPQERGPLRRAWRAIYLAPVGAGLLSFAALFGLPPLLGPAGGLVAFLIPAIVLLGAVVSAYGVAWLHPVYRGRWWLAGAAFLLALPAGVIATVCFALVAEVAMAAFIRFGRP